MKIVFTGGGTLGSVTPLLAIQEVLQASRVFWIGTRRGIERELISAESIPFFWVGAGKFRRYLDWRTLFAPFATFFGFVQSCILLAWLRPTYVFSAGGYVGVPVIFAAWVLRIPSFAIQLDVHPGLANRLVAPFVRYVFCTFAESARYFPKKKTIVTGAPVRRQLVNGKQQTLPTLVVLGGGTGALRLNELIISALSELTKICRVVHVTGKNKSFSKPALSNYQSFEFLTDKLLQYYAEADLVVTRAGMGTLSELAALAKAAIVIPLPQTHQEENAALLARHEAAVVLQQDTITPATLVPLITDLLHDGSRRKNLGERLHACIPTDGVRKIVQQLFPSS